MSVIRGWRRRHSRFTSMEWLGEDRVGDFARLHIAVRRIKEIKGSYQYFDGDLTVTRFMAINGPNGEKGKT